ncbi:MAG TPA: hypothetical protein VE775_08300, partial [Pyrinomonadaceae bacterium]|nr:hypothetical protein [Pyrinomonadaceae bacterium]
LERARTRRFIPCLVGATLLYALSLLTGHGQSFMQLGMLAVAYAVFLALCGEPAQTTADTQPRTATAAAAHTHAHERARSRYTSWARWRPLAVAASAIALGCGVAAWQILETLRAARRSIRSTLSYDMFGTGGFTPAEALRSLAAPLYHYIEVTTYQAPLILLLAAVAVACAVRARARRDDPRALIEQRILFDAHILFWFIVALVAFVLLLGGHTPLYGLLYRVPVFNLFRRPSRYVCEWTFALSILAAYGWDALAARAAATYTHRADERSMTKVLPALALLLLSGALAAGWWRGVAHGGGEASYLRWKFCFTLTTTLALSYGWRFLAPKWRAPVMTCALLLVCFVEPFILISRWWPGTAKPAARFTTPALTTRWLQQFPPTEQRVYVRANGPEEESAPEPRFDALDRTAPFGLHNVAGYESLTFERYSRALGNVEFDTVSPRPGYSPTRALFATRSHVLDLLNAHYVVTWPDLVGLPAQNLFEH